MSGNPNGAHQGWEQSAGMLLLPKSRWDKASGADSAKLQFRYNPDPVSSSWQHQH